MHYQFARDRTLCFLFHLHRTRGVCENRFDQNGFDIHIVFDESEIAITFSFVINKVIACIQMVYDTTNNIAHRCPYCISFCFHEIMKIALWFPTTQNNQLVI